MIVIMITIVMVMIFIIIKMSIVDTFNSLIIIIVWLSIILLVTNIN